MNDSLFWFLLFVIFIAIEVLAPGVILVFFAFGALITSILELFVDAPLGLEVGMFLVSSIASLGILRNKFKEALNARQTRSLPADEFIGRKVIVVERLQSGEVGRVELNGTDWNAISEDDFAVGEEVIIIGRENMTFNVAKIE